MGIKIMSFTGLYTEYYYFSKWIFVCRFRSGAFDYWSGREEICGWHKQTDIIKICLTPTKAKKYTKQLNRKIKR